MTVQLLPKTGTMPLIWRSLIGFWAILLLAAAGGVATLAILGPPDATPPLAVADLPPAKPAAKPPAPMAEPAARIIEPPPVLLAAPRPVPPANGSVMIAPPDPGLLEPSQLYQGGQLPRIGAGNRQPMQAYAAAFNSTDPRPRVAILLSGIGMNEAEALVASSNLPRQVGFAVSPYSRRLDHLLDAARAAGHELLLSIPMEPQGYPLNDPGNQALLTGASQASNAQRLEWSLTRFAGYVGATGSLGDMRGERFAAASDQMGPILSTLSDRGLLYVDPRPTALHPPPPARPGSAVRGVDLVIDDPPGSAEIDRALARLEQIARDRGAAIGLAGRPSPIVIDRLGVWAAGLEAHGVALAPVSVVVQMPQAPMAIARTNLAK